MLCAVRSGGHEGILYGFVYVAIVQHVVLPSLLQDGCEQFPTHVVRAIGLEFEGRMDQHCQRSLQST